MKYRSGLLILIYAVVFITIGPCLIYGQRIYTPERILELREEVRGMFQHAYEGYLIHADNYDELRPISCDGINTWGSYSLTLIDALDTLATMGNFTEFRRVTALLIKKMNFNKDINVSVFETNIRIVGGLLSAHLLSKRAGILVNEGWPCDGPLLRMAEDVARRLLPAFDTATGMPYGTVNLRYGVPKGETPVTCTACISTFLIEFGTLSRLTGNSIYEDVALNAVYSLWEHRSSIGLFGNHIDVQTGIWKAEDAGIGAGVDSFFEYLVKGSILLNRPELLELFKESRQAIEKYMKVDDWYVWVHMNRGHVTMPIFQSLEAFWPGILSIIGDNISAIRTLRKYSTVWRKYGFLPEFFNIALGEVSPNRESYPLRPELIESMMYLYRATKNDFLLELGEEILESIQFSAKTKCGYATIQNVISHEKENRMESFFLSETTKYLYLLFDKDNFLHNRASSGDVLKTSKGECVIHAGEYIFNTEAHPIDMSALHCCHGIEEDLFAEMDLQAFESTNLLKMDREIIENRKSTFLNDCSLRKDTGIPSANNITKKYQNVSNVSVDIEVYDEYNQPVADSLVQIFEQIKNERKTGKKMDSNSLKRHQLTVDELEKCFLMRRDNFSDAQDVLNYVLNFMRHFTLDPAFIRGLEIFDKNLRDVLGANVQKEYESRMRTIYELYDLHQQYSINAELFIKLHLLGNNTDNRDLVDNALIALQLEEESELDDIRSKNNVDIKLIWDDLNTLRGQYYKAMINTTAMQEFLLKILINGTTVKNRSFKPLLEFEEISTLPIVYHDVKNIFSYSIKILKIKKQIIMSYKKMQNLLKHHKSLERKSNTPSKNTYSKIDESSTSRSIEKFHKDSESLTTEKVDNSESVWSQLVRTILRKTNVIPEEFDEELLMRKTQIALLNYTFTAPLHNVFTCNSPKYIDKFVNRNLSP